MIEKVTKTPRRPVSISMKVVFVISVLILPLNFMAIMIADKVISTTVTQAMEADQSVIDLYMAELTTRMEEANNLLFYFISSDPNCIEMVQQRRDNYQYRLAKLKFFSTLKHMNSITDAADGYFYYMTIKDDLLIYGPSTAVKEVRGLLNDQILLSDELVDTSLLGWHLYQGELNQYGIYFFQDNDVIYGAWINLDELKSVLYDEIEYDQLTLFFTEQLSSKSLKNQLNVTQSGKSTKGIWISSEYQIKLVANAKNILLNLCLSKKEVLDGIDFYLKFIKGFALVYLILIPVLYVAIRRLLLNPLRFIGKAHQEIENGNHDFRLSETYKTLEYNKVFKSFNRMASQLHRYKIEAYEKELERQKMELRNLQLQIRPHFLLNTFNLIYTLTQQNNNTSIQSIILYLSDYFRYIFRDEKELSLFSKELSLIKNYIEIISIRYNGQIKFDEEVDPEFLFVRMPPLLIHNFVENAVKYGKKEGQLLYISIKGEYDNGWAMIYILDDGNGFDDKILEYTHDLFAGKIEPDDKSAHLGLYNSYKRLKYFFGEDASIDVESEKGNQTLVTIRFRYNLEVNDEFVIGE